MEAIGDITASAEASRVDVQGLEFDSRIQGGILVCTSGPSHRPLSLTEPAFIVERRPWRPHLRPFHCDAPFYLCAEQRRDRDHPLRKSVGWSMVLRLPYSVRHPGQDIRCFLSEYVFFLYILFCFRKGNFPVASCPYFFLLQCLALVTDLVFRPLRNPAILIANQCVCLDHIGHLHLPQSRTLSLAV